MEKIDLNNYEAYFLDYMEGTLSAEEKHDLFLFLEQHPALKAELELDFDAVSLFPESVQFESKEALKIDEKGLIISPNTLPDLMIASVEKQLSTAHETQLAAYIADNGLEKMYASYKATILEPDMSIVYAEKAELRVRTGLVFNMPSLKRVAAIAAVGLILISFGINWNKLTGSVTVEPNGRFANDRIDAKLIRTLFGEEENGEVDIDLNRSNLHDYVDPQTTPKSNVPKEIDEFINTDKRKDIAVLPKEDKVDSVDFINNKPQSKQELVQPNLDEFVEKDKRDSIISIPEINPNVEVYANVRKEEPYKLVTDAASNLIKSDVEYTRDRNLNNNDLVAYSFKLGGFSFEHKKGTR